jgi:Ser/Thr protein kinase RdoA (MazF antagonist)
MTFPVSHSTLDAGALAAELGKRFALPGNCVCRLVARGSNDLYRVECGMERYALRVSRAYHRTAAELGYELDLLAFLAGRAVRVPAPVPLANADRFFSVSAPEGERLIVMIGWIDGRPLDRQLSRVEAEAAGRLLADLHVVARDFRSSPVKEIDTVVRITRQLRYLDRLLPHGTVGREQFDHALDAVRRFFSGQAAAALPRGPTHGDFQFANVMKSPDGTLWAIDFDDCGLDITVKDLITFEWRARLEQLPQEVIDAFRGGYESRCPLTIEEVAALPMLRVARDLYLIVSYAAYIDRIGPVAGFEAQSRLVDLMVEDTARAGLA